MNEIPSFCFMNEAYFIYKIYRFTVAVKCFRAIQWQLGVTQEPKSILRPCKCKTKLLFVYQHLPRSVCLLNDSPQKYSSALWLQYAISVNSLDDGHVLPKLSVQTQTWRRNDGRTHKSFRSAQKNPHRNRSYSHTMRFLSRPDTGGDYVQDSSLFGAGKEGRGLV